MIKTRFTRGSNYIDVKIKKREVTFITPALNFQPVIIDLDKLDEHKETISKMKFDKEVLEELSKLETEEELFKDLEKDLIKSGWRSNGIH